MSEAKIDQESGPLGLWLNKTESFVNSIHMKLQRKINLSSELTQNNSLEEQNAGNDKHNAEPRADKLRIINVPVLMLKIGSWQCVSVGEGDIAAKCFYGKKKFVWEMLRCGSKKKFEIEWSDISAIRAHFADKQPDILEVELKKPPQLFELVSSDPRRHPMWQPIPDFTEDQSRLYRRHHLEFREGSFRKPYDKLLLENKHLFKLSHNLFENDMSPHFGVVRSGIQYSSTIPQLLHMFNQQTNNLYHSFTDHFGNQGTTDLSTRYVGNSGYMAQSFGANLPTGQPVPPFRLVDENKPNNLGCISESVDAYLPTGFLPPTGLADDKWPSSDNAFLEAAAAEHSGVLNHIPNMDNRASSSANLVINPGT
ncbi:unnamed protein product [Musa hybrid cultivar]